MVTIRNERSTDIAAREALLDRAFGAGALRQDRPSACAKAASPAEGLSFVATRNGRLVGTVRLWHVTRRPGRPALLLGPLAVDGDARTAASALR